MSRSRKERFRHVLANRSLQDAFGNDLFKLIDRRRSELERIRWKLIGVQLPIFLCLTLILLPIGVKFSFLGVTPESVTALREVFLIASAVLGLAAQSYNSQLAYLNEMMEARAEKLAGDNEDAKTFLRLAYGVESEWWHDPVDKHLSKSAIRKSLTGLYFGLGIVIAVVVLCGMLTIQLLILRDIYLHPNFSEFVSIAVIGFVLIVDSFILVAFMQRSGILPFIDTGWQDIFGRWKKKNPQLYANLMQIAQFEHNRKGFIRWLLTRPNPVKAWKRAYRQTERLQREKARQQQGE